MQDLEWEFIPKIIGEPIKWQPAKTLFRSITTTIIALSLASCGTADGGSSEMGTDDEARASIWLNPLMVTNGTHRVTAKFQTFVCPNPTSLERAVALHNTGRVERMADMGCLYVSEGDQGVQLKRIGRSHEILFDTAKGSVELWGFEGHYDY